MSTKPFDYTDKSQRIRLDLSNQAHRDIVIQRNKNLNNAIENGLDVNLFRQVKVEITTNLDCLKCGSSISGSVTYDYGFDDFEIENEIPSVECYCCKTKYYYNKRNFTFELSFPKVEIEKYKV